MMFYESDQFPFVHELQARWRLIRQEYLELDAPLLDLRPATSLDLYVEALLQRNGWTPSWQIEETNPGHAWLTYALSYKRMQPDDLPSRMPATSRLLARLEGVHIAAISVLRPGTFTKPHAHPQAHDRRLTLHLGLDLVPQRSFLCVGSDMHEQGAGRILIFDGAYQHFAINTSTADRAVLYIEFCPGTAAFAAA